MLTNFIVAKLNLHIVSLNVPYPPNYGGIIDIFYKIKALHQIGVSITLHCYEYGRGTQIELNKYCSAVHYYSRKKSVIHWFKNKPFIVASRNSKILNYSLGNLKQKSRIFELHRICSATQTDFVFLLHFCIKLEISSVRAKFWQASVNSIRKARKSLKSPSAI